jgi:hypothetical protein
VIGASPLVLTGDSKVGDQGAEFQVEGSKSCAAGEGADSVPIYRDPCHAWGSYQMRRKSAALPPASGALLPQKTVAQ